MSRFVCTCGEVTHESEEAPDTSGILLGFSTLHRFEECIADTVAAYVSKSPDQRPAWIKQHFGPGYPTDVQLAEVVSDIISKALHNFPFHSTFRCPSCGRLAVAPPPARSEWLFYLPE